MRVLIVGQGSRYSGYGRVLRALAPLLARDFEVSFFLLQCSRTPSGQELPRVRCVLPTLRSDPFGLAELPAVLRRVRPDVVLACHDPQALAAQLGVVRACAQAHVVLYLPLEWRWLEPSMLRELAAADLLVCYTETARRWLLDQLGAGADAAAVAAVAAVAPVAAAPIPHGVDRSVFGPVEGARTLLGVDARETVVLNANRDTDRKRLRTTLQAFALVAETLPEVRLLLTHGQDLRAEARRLRVEDRVLIPARPPESDGELNQYYNCADIGLNTCSAEGWGLVAVEHAVAAGAAQLMPGHPALREIWGPAAAFVGYRPTEVEGYGLVDPVDVAEALAALCRDRERRAELGRLARARAGAAEFAWPEIAQRWREVLTLSFGGVGATAPSRSGS